MIEKEKVVSSLGYKFIEQILVKIVGLIISVILARLISPNDFGLLAIITVFINLSQTLVQGGFNTALVQSKDVDDKDYSTVFYISLLAAALLILGLYIGAPFISHFYKTEELVWPLRVYALSLLFGAFNSVQVAKLQKEMRFKVTMYASLLATILTGILGIVMAYNGAGIWALVIYNLSHTVLSCFTMLFFARWIPRLVFSCSSAKKLFSYGWKMFASSFLCSIYMDMRTLIIGKKFSTGDLGYYNRGQQFPVIVSNTFNTSIQAVMFPTIASVQDDYVRVKSLLKRSLSLAALVIIPLMVGLAVASENIVLLLLTDKWLPCVFYMQIICLADIAFAFTSSNLVSIKAIGRSDIYMKLEGIRRIVMLTVLAISLFCFDSVKAVAIGYLISAWIDYVIITVPIKRILNYGILEQIRDTWKILVSAACVGVVVYVISFLEIPIILELFLQVVAGAGAYVIICLLLKTESFYYLKNMISKKLSRH